MVDTTQIRLDGGVQTLVGHCRKDDIDTYVGRGDGGDATMHTTPIGDRGWLGNPYTLETHDREESIAAFREDFEQRLETDAEFRAAVADLAGETIGCWCQRVDDDGPACHAEVVAQAADRLAGESDE